MNLFSHTGVRYDTYLLTSPNFNCFVHMTVDIGCKRLESTAKCNLGND